MLFFNEDIGLVEVYCLCNIITLKNYFTFSDDSLRVSVNTVQRRGGF